MKPRESVLEPDPRFAHVVHVDDDTGQIRPIQIDDLYSSVQPLELSPAVPEDIRLQFDAARNTFLYSWFAYEMVTLAERHSYAVLEMALRIRVQQEVRERKPRVGLKHLLEFAVKSGWLHRQDFEVPSPFVPGKTISLFDMTTKLRNNLAHGKMHLYALGSLRMMRLCAEINSKLFPSVPGDGDDRDG